MKKVNKAASRKYRGIRKFFSAWINWFVLEHAFRNEKAVQYLEKRASQFA